LDKFSVVQDVFHNADGILHWRHLLLIHI